MMSAGKSSISKGSRTPGVRRSTNTGVTVFADSFRVSEVRGAGGSGLACAGRVDGESGGWVELGGRWAVLGVTGEFIHPFQLSEPRKANRNPFESEGGSVRVAENVDVSTNRDTDRASLRVLGIPPETEPAQPPVWRSPPPPSKTLRPIPCQPTRSPARSSVSFTCPFLPSQQV